MPRIIIITHGTIATAMQNTMEEFFMTKHQISAINLEVGDDQHILFAKLDALNLAETEQIIVFTDIISGTPFNVACVYFEKYRNAKVLYGINLAMLFAAATNPEFDENLILAEGKKAIGRWSCGSNILD